MKIHQLKIWPHFLNDIETERRNFEIRSIKDRSFQVGDQIMLNAFDPNRNEAISRPTVFVEIVDIFYALPGIESGYAVLAIKRVT